MTRRVVMVGLGYTHQEASALPAREAVALARMVLRMHPGLVPAEEPSDEALLRDAERVVGGLQR